MENDIYVKTSSKVTALVKRAETLLDKKKVNFINIHGLGRAVYKAVQVALQIRRHLGHESIQLSVETESCTMIDDICPDELDGDEVTQFRQNSAIHIRIKKQ